MEGELMSDSSNYSSQHQLSSHGQVSILASCYMASTVSETIKGFHYCTPNGAGIGMPEVPSGPDSRMTSPPHNISNTANTWPRHKVPRNSIDNINRGEAAQTITEECERLFCDTLSVMFLGERNRRHRTSLAMGAFQQNVRPDNRKLSRQRDIEAYLELWDYANDAIYRGFVVDGCGQRTLFVFLDSQATSHGIKTALLSLFELAELEAFECSQIMACVPRSDDPVGSGIVRNLGWCGFSLTSLDSWMPPGNGGMALSDRWLFLAAQVNKLRVVEAGLFKCPETTTNHRRSIAPAFPTFLLPSPSFPRRQRKASEDYNITENAIEDASPASSSENSKRALRSSHLSYIRCARCGADICHTSQIISKGFTGRHGRAYLVSPTDSASFLTGKHRTNNTAILPNTITQRAVPRQLVTGAHTVADINCMICGSVLGWKYIAAEEEAQRYKVGKYIIETKRITTSSCWEFQDDFPSPTPSDGGSASPLSMMRRSSSAGTTAGGGSGIDSSSDLEFDSQDEDECEDLFAGVWSPGLARRRRNRKLSRKL
ncbi:yippee family protein [Talaromyces stipitatus ATCC 10500]|uniref:Yippee family protein n=1 Tax=Talaromyces stipitatus (strain ATCC 10500 / CBS 375.48 / QM 6759 / NRRL 1006) TaxID=441959 RepID=B8LT92_TALSN|nr:yippee family protein [Talaromyces stipitatus ATCC 10500]EED23600.1 yippee family protein [Talaromyces stipitatus ATCC 10500]